MNIAEGFAPFGAYQTWYRVTGDLYSSKTPVIVLHGGPGCTHDYLENIGELAHHGRAIIHYDQVGNGRSTHLPKMSDDFWRVDLFVDELANLISHLGLIDYILLGQSWGSMLASEFSLRAPAGLVALILANPVASMPLWISETTRLRQDLPPNVLAVLEQHEAAGTTATAEYEDAVAVFNAKHVCRLGYSPPALQRTWDAMKSDPTVYLAMNGPTDFPVVGSLKDWQIGDRAKNIGVPVLLLSGRHDQATATVVQPFMHHIDDVRWHIIPDSGHITNIERPERFFPIVQTFLEEQDAQLRSGNDNRGME
jgi:L-proline amide hydrolase